MTSYRPFPAFTVELTDEFLKGLASEVRDSLLGDYSDRKAAWDAEFEVIDTFEPVDAPEADAEWAAMAADERDYRLDDLEWLRYDAEGELEAERRNELFWENRGQDDGFDQWERDRGVVDYWEAKAEAEALYGEAV